MKEIEEIFGGANAEEQNVLLHIIKERGYKFFEETPKTTMAVRLLEDLHKLGYEIQPKAKNNEVLDLVSKTLHISDFHIGFKYMQYEMDSERYLNKGMIWVKKEYGFNSPRLHKIKELIDIFTKWRKEDPFGLYELEPD